MFYHKQKILSIIYDELLQTQDINLLIEIVEKFTDLDANISEIEKLKGSKSPIERKFLEKIPRQSFEIGIRICEKLMNFVINQKIKTQRSDNYKLD